MPQRSLSSLRTTLAVVTALVLTALGSPTRPVCASTPPSEDPMQTVKQGVDQVLVVFEQRDTPLKVRRVKLRQIAHQYFDFEDMSRSALGYHWRDLTPVQRASFVPLFATFIEDAYLSKLQEYVVRKVQEEAKTAKIAFIRENFDGADDAQVFSNIVVIDQKDPIQVNYLMHRRDNTWLIYDVTVDAISVIANYRNQFNRVMNSDGYDKLFEDLTAKRTQLEQEMDDPQGTASN